MVPFNTKALFAAATTAMMALAAPAFAYCPGCTYNQGSSYDFSTGGEVVNGGTAFGDVAGVHSESTKDVEGGGESVSDTATGSNAFGYAAADFDTKGASYGRSLTLGGQAGAGSGESGEVVGNGMVQTTKNYGYLVKTDRVTFGYEAGGGAQNTSSGTGDLAWAQSDTIKRVSGGGIGFSGTGFHDDGATAYARTHMATVGKAGALSYGPGTQSANTLESGGVSGGGVTTVSQSTNMNVNN